MGFFKNWGKVFEGLFKGLRRLDTDIKIIKGELEPGEQSDSSAAEIITDLIRETVELNLAAIEATIKKLEGDIKQNAVDLWKEYVKWWETPEGFWLTIGGVAASGFIIPYAVEGLAALKGAPAIAKIFENMENLRNTIFKDTDFVMIELINSTAKLLFPSYRKTMEIINKGLAGILALIGIPTNTLSLLLESINGTYLSLSQVYGFNTESVYAKGLQRSSDFFSKMSDRVSRYVQKPELLWEDFRTEVQKPVYDEYVEDVDKYNSDILDRITKSEESRDAVISVIDNLQKVVDAIPEDMKTGKYEDFFNNIETFANDIKRINKYIDVDLQIHLRRIDRILSDNQLLIEKEAETKTGVYGYSQEELDNIDDYLYDQGLGEGFVVFKALYQKIGEPEED